MDDAMGEVGATEGSTDQRVARPESTGSRVCMIDSSMKRGLQERDNGIAKQQPENDVENNTHGTSSTRGYVQERVLSILEG